MRLLITGGNDRRTRAVVAALPKSISMRVIDTTFEHPLLTAVDVCSGDLRDPSFLRSALDGIQAILHLAPLSRQFPDDVANLDHATRGTYQLLQAALEAGITRVVIGSSLDLFASLPLDYQVGPTWRPRPRPRLDDLCPWLAECLARERAREPGARFACLRLANVLTPSEVAAVIEHALSGGLVGWQVVHIGSRSSQAEEHPVGVHQRAIRRIVIFGAGGPLAAAAARELKTDYVLRLADIRPPDHWVAAGAPQAPGAPMPEVLPAPHECCLADVTDPELVMRACDGMDAIINCTVVRRQPEGAFRVNALGAYNLMRAAVAHGIQRLVHTGPFQMGRPGATGYDWDTYVADEAPPRPGGKWELYFSTKLLGQEICRIFAEYYRLQVPALLFDDFANPAHTEPRAWNTFLVSWADAARALRAALEAALPTPFEILHINADLPHGVFPNDKAKRLLGWQPRDDLRAFWSG